MLECTASNSSCNGHKCFWACENSQDKLGPYPLRPSNWAHIHFVQAVENSQDKIVSVVCPRYLVLLEHHLLLSQAQGHGSASLAALLTKASDGEASSLCNGLVNLRSGLQYRICVLWLQVLFFGAQGSFLVLLMQQKPTYGLNYQLTIS
jgi:hypothetical protein